MHQPRNLFVLTLAVAILLGGASRARGQTQSDPPVMPNHSVFTEPSVIDSKGPGKGGYASLGESFSSLSGRSLWVQELLAGYGITDRISLYAGHQQYVVHGHYEGDTFDLQDTFYGGKWVIKNARKEKDTSWAAEFQIVVPSSATATTGSSSETFYATKDDMAAIDFGFGFGWQTQLSYSSVKGAAFGYGNVYALGIGKDFSVGSLVLRVQGQLIDDNTTGADLVHSSDSVRPVLYAALGYDATEWLRFEADGTLFTSGLPLAGTQFTGLSSFLVDNPGGAAEGLRSDTVGIASIRVIFHGKF